MRFVTLILLAVVGSAATSRGQGAGGAEPHLYQELFPHPSGENGFEELVLAGELLRAAPAWRAYDGPARERTLSAKRTVLADPAVRRALSLVRAGLAKPLIALHPAPDAHTAFPELIPLRALGRLMAVDEYVALADGRVSQAVSVLREGLSLGYAVLRGTLISSLTGVGIDSAVLHILGENLGQLSVGDCDLVIAVANRWLSSDDPTVQTLQAERDMLLRETARHFDSPETFADAIGPQDAGERTAGAASAFRVLASQDLSGARQQLIRLAAMLGQYLDALIAELGKPVWRRSYARCVPRDDGSLARRLFDCVAPAGREVMNRFAREQAEVQLLAVHAAIRRYRWENDKLPTTLTALDIARMILDPFTGKPLQYRVLDGRTYELFSVGYAEQAAGDGFGSARPAPIFFPPKAETP